MAVACASRFAVLKLEDDDVFENTSADKINSIQNNGQTIKNKSGNVRNGAVPQDSKSKPKKKKKGTNDVAELQNLAFGNGSNKGKNKNAQNSTASRNANPKQWEEWKKKDSEFVSGAYEQDLQQALILSKIDYEEKKDTYDAIQKESEHSKVNQKKKKKGNQKKEKGIMSLDEFQNLSSMPTETGNFGKGKVDSLDDFSSPVKSPPIDEPDFFGKIEEDVGKIICKEERQESVKKREEFSQVPDIALSFEFQDKLLKKDEEIKQLNEDINRLKHELKTVKTRNKKLYDILAAGEMKEKSEILIEIQDLTSVRDELTDQLNEYHASLEIERSKVHALQTELKKCQNNKKDRKDS